MLAELQALALVVRFQGLAVDLCGFFGQGFVDEAAYYLAVFYDEGDFEGSDFEDGFCALAACAGVAEAGVEEAGVVDAEFADQSVIGDHFGGVVDGDADGFLAGEDVELAGVEDEAGAVAAVDGFPEVLDRVVILLVHVDEAGVGLGTVADKARVRVAGDVDGDGDAVLDVILGQGSVDDFELFLEPVVLGVGSGGEAAANSELVESRAFSDQYAEGTRGDLGVHGAGVAGLDLVELDAEVGDEPGENVEAAGRALGVADGAVVGGQVHRFHEGHDVDAATFEDGAAGEVELVHRQGVDALLHGVALAREEAGADAVGLVAQPEVDAGRLDLFVVDGVGGLDGAGVDQIDEGLGWEDAGGFGVRSGEGVFRHGGWCFGLLSDEGAGFLDFTGKLGSLSRFKPLLHCFVRRSYSGGELYLFFADVAVLLLDHFQDFGRAVELVVEVIHVLALDEDAQGILPVRDADIGKFPLYLAGGA